MLQQQLILPFKHMWIVYACYVYSCPNWCSDPTYYNGIQFGNFVYYSARFRFLSIGFIRISRIVSRLATAHQGLFVTSGTKNYLSITIPVVCGTRHISAVPDYHQGQCAKSLTVSNSTVCHFSQLVLVMTILFVCIMFLGIFHQFSCFLKKEIK